jgi:hypothetical protein
LTKQLEDVEICKGVKLLIFFFVSIIWSAGGLSGRTEDFTHKIGKSEYTRQFTRQFYGGA